MDKQNETYSGINVRCDWPGSGSFWPNGRGWFEESAWLELKAFKWHLWHHILLNIRVVWLEGRGMEHVEVNLHCSYFIYQLLNAFDFIYVAWQEIFQKSHAAGSVPNGWLEKTRWYFRFGQWTRELIFIISTKGGDVTPLLMAEIQLTSWYGKYPIIYRVLYISGGAGFLPSTVWTENVSIFEKCMSSCQVEA